MEKKTVTIQTNTQKKGKLDQRTFACQTITLGEKLIYVLDETKNDLTRKRFNLTPGCRIIDDGIVYSIEDIQYWKKPKYPFLVTYPKSGNN